MAVKTITIDMEAYEILSKEKGHGESFSKLIKRKLRYSNTAGRIMANLDKMCPSEKTLSRIEKIVNGRKKSTLKHLVINT